YTEGTELAQTADNLRQAGLPVRSVELIMHPNQTIDLAPGDAMTVLRMVEALEDLDDVKQVFHNLTLNPEVLAEMAG
ncbi:MAG: YebC/PmpR family DNA-binding transcriptional regulator, partial [Caldilineaceae bacterium]|nr:YebC/PmpR family DNA-binding transcriptional regulator [Caldilineaceae bacterium]